MFSLIRGNVSYLCCGMCNLEGTHISCTYHFSVVDQLSSYASRKPVDHIAARHGGAAWINSHLRKVISAIILTPYSDPEGNLKEVVGAGDECYDGRATSSSGSGRK